MPLTTVPPGTCRARCGHCFGLCSGRHLDGLHGVSPDEHWRDTDGARAQLRQLVAEQGARAIERQPPPLNTFFVGGSVDGSVSILRAPLGRLTKEDALNLAAYLIVLAGDHTLAETAELIDRICQ